MRLRAARAGDAAAIAALHLASWRDAYRGVLDDQVLDVVAPVALPGHWTATLPLARPGAVILAVADGAPAGFVAAYVEGATAYVDNLHVAPGLRGGGVGRVLLGLAARRLRRLGCTRAELFAFAGNTGALRFYARLGAAIGPVQPCEVHGHPAEDRICAWEEIGTLIAATAPPGRAGGAAAGRGRPPPA
jgi:ribosomal protein S18 acetylase RimI-like enzyme